MKRKAYRRVSKHLSALADKWIGPLGLKWWTVTQELYDNSAEYARATGNAADSSLATCRADWAYRTAHISFNCPLWRGLADADFEHYYLHELCHIFLAELQHDTTDRQGHIERVCQTLADAFLWVREKGAE